MASVPAVETLEIPVGDMTFRARAAGPADGPLVLLLHGWPQTSYCWRTVLPALAEAGYRAVAPDQRGYSPGARPDGVDAYAAAHLVADVLAVADWLGGHDLHVVGHDWGGAVAWAIATRYPERLRSLTVVSTPHPAALRKALSEDLDQKKRSAYMLLFQAPAVPERALLALDAAGLRKVYGGLPADVVDEYLAVLTEPGALTATLNWYRALRTWRDQPLGPVTVPTLYVWSDEDPALGRTAAEATAEHVDGPYRFEVLEDVDHWVPEVAGDRLNALLLEHLSAHP